MAVPRTTAFGNAYRTLGSQDLGFKTDWDAVRDQEAEFKAYLGTTDYAAQNKEATDFAKLQFALSLMGRGFAAMGAAPEGRESPAGTLGRTLIAPIAGDFSTIAGTLMKQRSATKLAERQEERQRKMAAWTAARGSAKDRRDLAEELTPTDTKDGLTEAVQYVLAKGADNKWNFVPQVGGEGRTQVRQQKGTGAPYNIVTMRVQPLLKGQVLAKPGDLAKYSLAEGTGTEETDAQRSSADRRVLLANAFGTVQAMTRGPNMPLTDRSAVIYKPELANAGKFPFWAVDQAFPGDRSKDMPLPEMYQKILQGKIDSAANLIKGEMGTTGALAREGRVVTAANSILRLTPQLLYGATDVPEVGYTNESFLKNRVEQGLTVKGAAKALRDDPAANPVDVYPSVVYPTNTQQINQSPYRVKIATKHFPRAMDISKLGDPNKGIRGGYNPEVVTDRLRIERVLGEVLLRANDNEEQHRAVIQKAAAKLAAKQEALQTKSAPRQEEIALRLALRQALINFKNAARETKIEGFFTGTLASFAATVGWQDILAGDMAPHWTALTVASDRLSEGLSRRQGKEEFGDDRLSNADAEAYKKLVADISKGTNINKLLIDQHLSRLEKEIGGIVKKFGGSTAFERETLEEVTRIGVDLSEASTKNEWHGHGFYGGTRFKESGQFAPTLSQDTREALRREGRLKDSMYLGAFQVPTLSYRTGQNPAFSKDTIVSARGQSELDQLIENVEKNLKISKAEAKKRVLNGITGYYSYRDTLRE